MHQARLAAGLLDLIGNPIPVSGGFYSYLRSWLAFMQCCSNRSRPVLHAILSQLPGVGLLVLHPRVMLVTIKGNIFFHARLLSFSSPAPNIPPSGVALSYFHSDRSKPTFFPLLRSCEGVGLRSGATV